MANGLDTEHELDAEEQTAQSEDTDTVQQDAQTHETVEHGEHETTDWKAQARKWEKRAKQYKAKLDSAGEQEGTLQADSKQDPHDADELTKRIAQLEAENQQLKAAGERHTLMERVAKDTGVPASLLHGDSEEELRAMAESLQQWASSLGHNTPTSLGSEPDTPQSANLELIRELFSEQ